MRWLRAVRSFIARVRMPEREAYLREHERERELGMQQIREMMETASDRGRAASDHEPKG